MFAYVVVPLFYLVLEKRVKNRQPRFLSVFTSNAPPIKLTTRPVFLFSSSVFHLPPFSWNSGGS